MRRLPCLFAVAAAALLLPSHPATAAEGMQQCRVVDLDFKPAEKLQIVAWLEDTSGNYVTTLFITDGVGRRGLGNRPGRFDFNSGPRWPYGRRITTFPVWAHRHGVSFPRIAFQNADDNNLSHPFNQSSSETFFCRPLRPDEAGWDTGTCSSPIFTDKGKAEASGTSLYPPRADIARVSGIDDQVVGMFDDMNPFDEVSSATPVGNAPYEVTWPIPSDLPTGDYVVWMEVSKEFDHNATYNATRYPEPTGIPWSDYGEPYRGQPSVLYKVPFRIGTETSTAMTSTYAGYGDPDGLDGNVRAPDTTIDTATPGSGGARFLLHTDGADSFRLRVISRPEFDAAMPGTPTELQAIDVAAQAATVSFVAPGEDGALGQVSGYEVRVRAGEPITEANFTSSTPVGEALSPDEPGQVQLLELGSLLPQTVYYVAVRAYDDCKNYGPIAVTSFTTRDREAGEVDACFVATAAYGSLMANEVSMLRAFREGVLRRSVLGTLFVQTYYTVGPAFAAQIEQSEPLRHAARDGLAPLVDLVKGLKVER